MKLAVAAPPEWQNHAACADPIYDAEAWHPVSEKERPREPIEVCNGCPVLAECRAYAIARPALEGIWGGLTWPEREKIRRGRTRKDVVRAPRGVNSVASAGVRRR